MKKSLFVIVAALLASVGTIRAEVWTGTCETNLSWSIDSETGVLAITGEGTMIHINGPAPWDNYKEYVTSLYISKDSYIYAGNVDDCSNLASIVVEDGHPTYKVVDNVLFNKDMTILYLFPKTPTGEYVVPETVKIINDMAFMYCDLTSIILPEGLEEIKYYGIGRCYSLQSLNFPNSIKTIGTAAFEGLPAAVGPLYNNTIFAHFTGGTTDSYTIPEGIERICYAAFEYCQLTEIILPSSLKVINNYAFRYAQKLKSITIPDIQRWNRYILARL